MTLKQDIGNKIKEIRESLNLSQEKFAEKLNMDVSFISGIENGHRNITLDTLEKITKALNKNIINYYIPSIIKSKEIIEQEEMIKKIKEILPNLNINILKSIYSLLKPFIK